MKKFLLIAAMDSEFEDIIGAYGFKKNSNTNAYEVEFGNKSLIIAKVGVGPINAAMALTHLLDTNSFDEVILLGLGGAIDQKLNPGDIVIATSVVQHDAICSYDDRKEFMACGELHLSLEVHDRKNIYMKASEEMNQRYEQYLRKDGMIIYKGVVASGSEFVGSKAKKEEIRKSLNDALMVDMEACSVAYICNHKGIKFSIIKTVADTMKENSSVEYVDFLKNNKRKCAEIIKCIKEL